MKSTASTRFFDLGTKFAEGAGVPEESALPLSLTINNSCGRDESGGGGERACPKHRGDRERNSIFWLADKKIVCKGKKFG